MKQYLLNWILRSITRIDVIAPGGRQLSLTKIVVEASIQDQGRTLKLFWN